MNGLLIQIPNQHVHNPTYLAALLPPPVELPQTVADEPRRPAAWYTLFILFGAMIFLTVYSYLKVGDSVRDSLEEAEVRVHSHVLRIAQSESFGNKAVTTNLTIPNAIKNLSSKSAEAAKLLASKSTKPATQARIKALLEAAKLNLAMDFEDNKPISTDDLKTVRILGDVQFAQIYSAKKLSRKDADSLIAQMPDDPNVEVLAKVHVLKKAGVAKPYLAIVTPGRLGLSFATEIIVFLLIGLGVTLWIAYFAFRANGWAVRRGHPALPMTIASSERFAIRAAQLLCLFIFVSIIAEGLTVSKNVSQDVGEVIATFGLVVGLIAISQVSIDGKKISMASIGWSKENLGRNVLWGLAAAVANVPVLLILVGISNVVFQWLPSHPHPISLELGQTHSLLTILLISITASIGAPIFEESLFRGILLPAISTRFRSGATGILLSSFLFAALHPTGPPQWLPLAGIGAVSACLSYQTKSLVPSVVMHAAHNLGSLLIVLAVR